MNITIWLTGKEVKTRWSVNAFELRDFVLNYGLPAYEKGSGERITAEDEDDSCDLGLYDMSTGQSTGMSQEGFNYYVPPPLVFRIDQVMFKLEDIEHFEREHPELREVEALEKEQSLFCQKTASGLDAGPEQENKAFMKDYDHDILIVWKGIVNYARSSRKAIGVSRVSELQRAAKDRMQDPEYNMKRLKAEDFVDNNNFFAATKDSANPKRYFRETLLQEMIQKKTPKKDIKKSEIRKFFKKTSLTRH